MPCFLLICLHPPQGIFAVSVYEASEIGNAAIYLYQSDIAFSSSALIDTLEIKVDVLPEPSVQLFLGIGALLADKLGHRD